MKVHLFATERHYERHVRAVWRHLPDELRGLEITGRAATERSIPGHDYFMIGGFNDIDRVQRHRIIYVEHGAGQSYNGAGVHRLTEAYAHANSTHPQRVMAYISPRLSMAEAWGRPAFAAGVPALDGHVRTKRWLTKAAITFHWDARIGVPEARSARGHWIDHLHSIVQWLRDYDFEVIGHRHPRDRDAPQIWENLGVRYEPDVDQVLREASLVIADNTSVMYEAAALEIPVLALNAPWYRRNVDHGLRFWEAVPGMAIDDIDELVRLDPVRYVDSDVAKTLGKAAAIAAYDGFATGNAGEQAARWLVKLLSK